MPRAPREPTRPPQVFPGLALLPYHHCQAWILAVRRDTLSPCLGFPNSDMEMVSVGDKPWAS